MKNLIVIGLLLIFFIASCQAQNIYSKENLENVSMEDLNLYLVKAMKLKKTGAKMLIVGPLTFVTGGILVGLAWSVPGETVMVGPSIYAMSLIMIISSPFITLTGICALATGSKRVNIISEIWNESNNEGRIEIAPCSQYNYLTNNFQPGIKLRISF